MRKEFRGRMKGAHSSKVHMSYICILSQMFGFSSILAAAVLCRVWQHGNKCFHFWDSKLSVFCQLSSLDTLSCSQMLIAQFWNRLKVIKSLALRWMPWCIILGEQICARLDFMDKYHFPYVWEFELFILFYRQINCFQALPTISLKIC